MADPPSIQDPPIPWVIRFLNWRVLVPILLVLVLLMVGGTQGTRAFRRWKDHRLALKAAASLDRGDLQEAALTARHVLQRNPNHIEACRVMAELARLCNSSESLAWRAHIVALDPENLRARLDWAGEALARGETTLANQVLLGVKPADRTSTAYHEIAAGLAIAVRQFSLAHRHLATALKHDPKNPRLRLNLATLELASNNKETRARAEASLGSLRNEPAVRLLALRTLLANALQAPDLPRAITVGQELAFAPGATFRDKLLHLGILYRTKHPDAYPRLMELKQSASPSSSDAGEMIAWMNANGMAEQAIAWAHTLPVDVTRVMPVPVTLAEAHALTRNWEGLLQMIAANPWGEFEALRLAISSRAFRELGNETGSQFQWRTAVRVAFNQPEMLTALTRLAASWGWKKEAEQLLWDLAGQPTPPRAVLQALYRHYQGHRDTKGLRRVLQRVVELDPADVVALNNLALFSLLLNADLDEAFKHARDLHEEFPKEAAFSSTHAFALHRRGRTAEGLKVLGALDPSVLRSPSIAAYYGILLVAAGDKLRAREFLDLSAPATLLPQEEALVTEARRKARP